MALRVIFFLSLALSSGYPFAQHEANHGLKLRQEIIGYWNDPEYESDALPGLDAGGGLDNATPIAELPNDPATNVAKANPLTPTIGLSDQDVRDIAIESYTKPRTANRQFLLVNSFLIIAAVADAETTLHDLTLPGVHEANPILGAHPTRGRVYGLGVPLTALTVYMSYHYKRASPTRNFWKVLPLTAGGLHLCGAVNNVLVAHYR